MASGTNTQIAHPQIPLEEVLKATDNFHKDNIIGRGGLGPAYKGRLLWSGKLVKIVALRLDRKHGGSDVEFLTELSMLSDLKHTNLVSLIAFCDEKNEKIIITTYAAKGSLKEHLKNPNLTWTQRLKICIGVARALSYLHYDESRGYGVIHLNINSSTILIDENWEAKLSGFKVSIKQPLNRMDRVVLSEPIGTIGYMDPEFEKTKGVTQKSDIYSFGVVLFEILCGRMAYIKNDADRFLTRLAKFHYENETLKDIILPDLRNQILPGSLKKYSDMAYSCIKEGRAHRPHILNIVKELEKSLKLQLKYENLGNKWEHLKIPLSDIQIATNNFSKTYEIGPMDDYTSYRAELGFSGNENHSSIEGKNKGEYPKRSKTVVIRRYPFGEDSYGEKYFFREIEVLTSVKHPNIVTLHGFCVEGLEMILVIEDVSKGYLGDYLGKVSDMRILTWEKRLKICIDVAHALDYLHSEMEDQKVIINRDIRSPNIGLDENLGAKVYNFRFSLFLPSNQEDGAIYPKKIAGYVEYIDPIYRTTKKLKRESDVYGLGVVMFEILCGRSATDPIYKTEKDKELAHMARRSFSMGTLKDMIDPILMEETDENNSVLNSGANMDSLHTFIEIARHCVEVPQDERPTMKVVVKKLESALFLQQMRQTKAYVRSMETLPMKRRSIFRPKLTWEELPFEELLQDEQVWNPNTTAQDFIDGFHHRDMLAYRRHRIKVKKLEHLKIPLKDIQLATDNFSEEYKIASRDGLTLYKAELDHFQIKNHPSIEGKKTGECSKRRHTVVIRRYPSGHDTDGEKEFFTEIEMLSIIKHPNIVTLLGYCVEGFEMIIVTENDSNGYLSSYLEKVNDMRILTWEKRLKICIDVAHGLRYIHYEMENQKAIINRNISSYDIGLDENLGARISNFGRSIFVSPNQEALYPARNVGNIYYIDPEYETIGKLKRESDVYSFGVVLFEILCGRIAIDQIYKESNKGLAPLARRSFRMGTLEDMIDPILKDETGEKNFVLSRGPNKDSLLIFIEIAHQCVAETQDQRPSIKVIVQELEKALFFQENNVHNPRVSLEDIKLATQNFHNDNCIGGGGFGKVYKGNLRDGEGFKTIVAKRLDTRFGQGEQQFLSELQILLEYKHENIIGLVGYCDEKDEKIIVYEFAPKGSLDRYLNDATLTWVKRLNICIDVASAFDFLHGGDGKQAKVIHRDIKSDNILLNNDWKAKVADFGLSLISPIIQETDYVIDYVCGTRGYLDPLYYKSGFLTIESDIYSFGVVLFEMLCGRSTFMIHKHEGHYLPDFIKNKFEEGKHDEIVFEQLKKHIKPKSLTTFQTIAYQCLQYEREKRPTTKEVLKQLKKALEFQISKGE